MVLSAPTTPDRDLVCVELGLALVRHGMAETARPFFDEAVAAIDDDQFDTRHGVRATRGSRTDADAAERLGVKRDRHAAVFLAAAAGAAAVGDGARGVDYLARVVKLRRARYVGDGHPMVASALCALAAARHAHQPGSSQTQVAHEWAVESRVDTLRVAVARLSSSFATDRVEQVDTLREVPLDLSTGTESSS